MYLKYLDVYLPAVSALVQHTYIPSTSPNNLLHHIHVEYRLHTQHYFATTVTDLHFTLLQEIMDFKVATHTITLKPAFTNLSP